MAVIALSPPAAIMARPAPNRLNQRCADRGADPDRALLIAEAAAKARPCAAEGVLTEMNAF